MANLDSLLDAVKNTVVRHVQDGGHDNFDTDGLLGKISNIFGAHKAASNVKPASEDPYGDPADQVGGRNVRPASQDPYGDPADQLIGRRH